MNEFEKLMLDEIKSLHEKIDKMGTRLDNVEKTQIQMRTELETSVNKCIQALTEGYQLNAERFDKFDIESIKKQSDLAFLLAKTTNDRVEKLIEQLNKTA